MFKISFSILSQFFIVLKHLTVIDLKSSQNVLKFKWSHTETDTVNSKQILTLHFSHY